MTVRVSEFWWQCLKPDRCYTKDSGGRWSKGSGLRMEMFGGLSNGLYDSEDKRIEKCIFRSPRGKLNTIDFMTIKPQPIETFILHNLS